MSYLHVIYPLCSWLGTLSCIILYCTKEPRLSSELDFDFVSHASIRPSPDVNARNPPPIPMQRRSNLSSLSNNTPSHFSPPSSRHTKPKPPHTIPIPLHRALTFFLWIVAIAKEHAFVSRGFFVFAYATGLIFYTRQWCIEEMR